MGEYERKERFNKLDGAHLLWASTMGATFDLGIMSKAMLTPSMRTAAQSIARHQMKKGIFPFIDGKPLTVELYKNIFDSLNEFIFFATDYQIEGNEESITIRIHKDRCMYCPTGVGGAMLGTATCPYPQLFSVYLDMVIKNGLYYKKVEIEKQTDGYMKRDGDYDIIKFRITEDKDFEIMVDVLLEGVKRIEEIFEKSLGSGILTENDLWDRNYIPIPNTNPKKYKTNFTDFAKKYIQPIEDDLLSKHKKISFAVLLDENGYVPAHNSIYDKPLTGDYKKDLVGNRSMRLFSDSMGVSNVINDRKYLLISYPRDIGILMFGILAEVKIKGKRWGAFSVGFKF